MTFGFWRSKMKTFQKKMQLAAIAALVISVFSGSVLAQGRGASRSAGFNTSVRKPTTSPYLNLLRGSGAREFSSNYFQRTRPEIEFRRAYSNLNRNVNNLRRRADRQETLLNSQLGKTGHSVSFFNYGSYFQLQGGRRSR